MKIYKYFFLFFFLGFITCYKSQYTLIPTGTTSQLNKISIINNNILINGRNNYLVKSYDECNNFTTLNVAGPVGYSNYLQRLDTSKLYVLSISSGNYKIFKSADGGNNWVEKYDTTMLLTHFRFFDSLEGIAVAPTYKLKRTKDGGNTWSSGPSPANITTAIEVFGDSMICIGDGSGTIYLSKNRGKTWPLGSGFPSSSYSRDIHFIDKDSLFVVSAPSTSGQCYFTKTFTGGLTWQNNSIIPLNNPYAIYFKTGNEGYIVGRDDNDNYGTILKTINSGQTWIKYKTQFQTIFLDINFINDSIALISGTGGELLKWNKNSLATSLINYSKENSGLTIYPNPTKDKLNIEILISETKNIKLNITNSLGQVVYSIDNPDVKHEIDLSFLTSGIYYLKVQNISEQKAFKIIKE
ncbi:MAG: T9SS type A sorting domain-containing protein [Bacteroidota bacterium]|nr:T9SS type A sorting domain-containing protein [Bacteroidota bacterium]MDP3146538.1 T9SS type A sorting domain-containing protein [Bacteroidota bacterium]MDP3555737.1 T9SS type A sorting domain-containing protein [Bacteroidota bacterium]